MFIFKEAKKQMIKKLPEDNKEETANGITEMGPRKGTKADGG